MSKGTQRRLCRNAISGGRCTETLAPRAPSRRARLGPLPLAAVGGAPLQRDPQHAVAQPHEERARAVQDAQAAQGLAARGRQHMQLLQVAAAEAAASGGQRLQDGARFWGRRPKRALELRTAQPQPAPHLQS